MLLIIVFLVTSAISLVGGLTETCGISQKNIGYRILSLFGTNKVNAVSVTEQGHRCQGVKTWEMQTSPLRDAEPDTENQTTLQVLTKPSKEVCVLRGIQINIL